MELKYDNKMYIFGAILFFIACIVAAYDGRLERLVFSAIYFVVGTLLIINYFSSKILLEKDKLKIHNFGGMLVKEREILSIKSIELDRGGDFIFTFSSGVPERIGFAGLSFLSKYKLAKGFESMGVKLIT